MKPWQLFAAQFEVERGDASIRSIARAGSFGPMRIVDLRAGKGIGMPVVRQIVAAFEDPAARARLEGAADADVLRRAEELALAWAASKGGEPVVSPEAHTDAVVYEGGAGHATRSREA